MSFAFTVTRNHWVLAFLWIIAQTTFGCILAGKGKLSFGGTVYYDTKGQISLDDLYFYHNQSGIFLLGYAAFLFSMKIILLISGKTSLFASTRRVNSITKSHYGSHYFSFISALLIQYASRYYESELHAMTGLDMDLVHKYVGFFIAANATILFLERLFFHNSAVVSESSKKRN